MFMESYAKTHPIHQHQKEETRNQWRKYMSIAKKLRGENTSALFELNLAALMGENLHDFWRYDGSLTTPPCSEGVIWTVFRQPIVFTETQIEKRRENILDEGHRPPQPLYHRIVYRNYLNESFSTIPDYNRCQIEPALRFPPILSSLLLVFTLILLGILFVKFVFTSEKKKHD